jgi:hypothetical protein
MAINTPDWNNVRDALFGQDSDAAVYVGDDVRASFEKIEADVERLIQEINSLQLAERELRTALEEPGTSEFQRR